MEPLTRRCFDWDRIVLTPQDHTLAVDNGCLTLERLAEHPLVTYVFSSTRESSFLNAFAKQNLEPKVVFTARDADVIKTYVRMGMGVGIIAPMALQCDDLEDLNAVCAKGLFPTVTTWLGFPRDKVLRQYMKDFIALFAPHWPEHLIEQAATAESQDIVDKLAEGRELVDRPSEGTPCEISTYARLHIWTLRRMEPRPSRGNDMVHNFFDKR